MRHYRPTAIKYPQCNVQLQYFLCTIRKRIKLIFSLRVVTYETNYVVNDVGLRVDINYNYSHITVYRNELLNVIKRLLCL